MKRGTWLVSIATLLFLTAPASAATHEQAADNGKTAPKQNFEQWQTIKRLQIINNINS